VAGDGLMAGDDGWVEIDGARWSPGDGNPMPLDDLDEASGVRYPHPWDWVEVLLCRTVGCTGPLSQWFMWPHRYVCTPVAMRMWRKDQQENR